MLVCVELHDNKHDSATLYAVPHARICDCTPHVPALDARMSDRTAHFAVQETRMSGQPIFWGVLVAIRHTSGIPPAYLSAACLPGPSKNKNSSLAQTMIPAGFWQASVPILGYSTTVQHMFAVQEVRMSDSTPHFVAQEARMSDSTAHFTVQEARVSDSAAHFSLQGASDFPKIHEVPNAQASRWRPSGVALRWVLGPKGPFVAGEKARHSCTFMISGSKAVCCADISAN